MGFVASQIHVSRPLTDMVVAYDPAEDQLLHRWFFPSKSVQHLTDLIRKRSKADMLRIYETESGPNAKSARVQFRMDSNLSYLAKPYVAEAVMDRMEAQDADAEVQYEIEQTQAANLAVQQSIEYNTVQNILRNTSILTANTTLAAAFRWDNFSSPDSSPVEDLKTAVRSVEMKTGKKVNRIGMSKPAWDALASNPNSLNRMTFDTKSTGAILTPAILEAILDVEPGSIKISRAIYTNSAMGQTATFKSFLGADVVVARVEDPKINTNGLGYEFAWSGFGSDSMAALRYEQMDLGPLGSDIVKVVTVLDKKVTNAEAAYLIKTAVNTSYDSSL